MSVLNIQLAALLESIRTPGCFHASGTLPLALPALTVEGVGRIALPLLPAQAQQMVAAAEQAPYGRGSETLVDTAVRRTWQIDAGRVRIEGRHWTQALEAAVAQVAGQLGVAGTVTAELYKLLVYDPGSFFVSHRDTEKAPGMFATLVIALPSDHEGGELVVRHREQEVRLALRSDDPGEAAFAAFYADCVHEVRPVTAGHRLVLVYNLLRRGPGKPPQAPCYDAEQDRLAALLQRWCAQPPSSPADGTPADKLVYLLEHAYTPAELSFAALKGADAGAAAVLAAAAQRAGCEVHAALLTIQESGSAEYTGRRSWHHRRLHGDDEADGFEVLEVFDHSAVLSHWARPDGQGAGLGELPLHDADLCPPEALEDLEPDEEHFQEATGNEGASFERTYHRATLVVWPLAQRLAVISNAGLAAALPYLQDLVRRWSADGSAAASPLRQQAHELAAHLLHRWPRGRGSYRLQGEPGDAAQVLALLQTLGDVPLIETCLDEAVATGDYDADDNPIVLAALRRLAPARAAALAARIVAGNAALKPGACADLLARGVRAGVPAGHLQAAAAALIEALPGGLTHRTDRELAWRARPVDAACIADLLAALPGIDAGLADDAVHRLLAQPATFDLDRLLLPALRRLARQPEGRDTPALHRMRAACVAQLRERTARPLRAPHDWSRANPVVCRCEHCRALGAFLADPQQPRWSLRAAEVARRHVEGAVRQHSCDVDCRTERRGNPHTLVCTKNQASYERAAAQRRQDLEDLDRLADAVDPAAPAR